jgi:hypothetical protein
MMSQAVDAAQNETRPLTEQHSWPLNNRARWLSDRLKLDTMQSDVCGTDFPSLAYSPQPQRFLPSESALRVRMVPPPDGMRTMS